MVSRQDPSTKDEQLVRAILQRELGETVQAPHFLKTRVLAELRSADLGSARTRSKSFFNWRRVFIIASPVAAAALTVLVMTWIRPAAVYQADTLLPVAVRVDVKDVQNRQVAKATIELPEGVEFYSDKHPEIAELKSVDLAWNEMLSNAADLPIVIKGVQSGTRIVKVRFYDDKGGLVSEKSLQIQFKNGQTSWIPAERIGA